MPNGSIVTGGGRVLAVTALAGDLPAARDLANTACARIHFEGAFYRHDIGDRVLAARH
jgi:phosphoribosylamine--glycine ligase